MIDEKRLESILEQHPDYWSFEDRDIIEHLARLGLWAKEHGIPALKNLWEAASTPTEKGAAFLGLGEALATLPKESK